MLEFVESRVANPVKLADWSEVEEGQAVVCPCCGWAGRLGLCDVGSVQGARAYGCAECGMTLVARAVPSVLPLRRVQRMTEWRRTDRMAANF